MLYLKIGVGSLQKNIAAFYWNYLNVILSQVNYLILKGMAESFLNEAKLG